MIAIAPFFSKIVKFFPPLVVGTIMVIIGLSLMSVPAGWIVPKDMDPNLAGGKNFLLAFLTLAVVVLVTRYSAPRFRSLAILAGIIVGTAVGQLLGVTNWTEVGTADWVGVPMPFQFGAPTFEFGAIVTMCIVGLVIMTETAADIVAVGRIAGRPADHQMLSDGLRADGLSTVLGGIFNTFPYAAFAQNVGLVSLTRSFSRYIVAMAGAILLVLGLFPKAGAIVSGVPSPVLGGAGLALFGMVTVSGMKTLSEVRWNENRALIVGLSVSIAMLPNVSVQFYAAVPETLGIILHSGIAVGGITVVILNLLLNREGGAHVEAVLEVKTQEEQQKIGADAGEQP